MKHKMTKIVLIGAFLACFISVGMAAWREDVSITKLRVNKIKNIGVSDATIHVEDPIALESR